MITMMQLIIFYCILIFCSFSILNLGRALPQNRPNILCIMTDQQQAHALSCTGNLDINTPNLDKLAENGVRFTRAYVAFPLCIPSRSSIWTGRMPHQVGVFSNKNGNNDMHPEDRERGLGHLLTNAGYECVYGGKWHVPDHDMVDGNGFKKIADFGDIGLAEKCIQFLKKDREREKPFFLVASFDNPHNICEWARNQPLPYGDISPPGALSELPDLPKNFEPAEFEPEALHLEQQNVPRVYPTRNYTKEDWQQYRYAYYRLVEKVDKEIGKILAALDEQGLTENTLVIFTSDHGDGNAAHGWNQKTALFEETINVPLIVSYNEKIQTGLVRNELVSVGLDLLPTLTDYANAEAPAGLDGLSLRPLLENQNVLWQRDNLFVETMFDGELAMRTMGRAVVTQKYKYVLYDWGKFREQLFDLETDPGEMINLAIDPVYSNQLNNFRKVLYEWCKRTNDQKFLRRIKLPDGAGSSSQLFDKPY